MTAARVGIGGPVGSGKTALIERLLELYSEDGTKAAVITNDLVTDEDAERLRGEGLESWRLDYADEDSVRDGAAEALKRSDGHLTALFNNGAWALPGPAVLWDHQPLRRLCPPCDPFSQ